MLSYFLSHVAKAEAQIVLCLNQTVMEPITPVVQQDLPKMEIPIEKKDEKFTPKGAIAFFILLVFLGLFIWFSIYFLMLDRT